MLNLVPTEINLGPLYYYVCDPAMPLTFMSQYFESIFIMNGVN